MTQQPKKSRRGLGRGLGALIQNTSVPEDDDVSEDKVAEIKEKPSQKTEKSASKKENKIDASKIADSLGARYLETNEVSREKRRPSDLFFGSDEPKQSAAGRKNGERVSMPNPILDRRPAENTEQGNDTHLRDIAIDAIRPNPRQPREEFEEEAMIELVASISEVGVLQPVVVRPSGGAGEYELIMGERRWRASRRAGLETIPAIVRDTADEDLLKEALLENIHRSELNALEEAAAYQQLMSDFGWSQDILAKRVGRSRPHISNTLRLMNLPPTLQRQVASGVLSAGHARAILGLGEEGLMTQLAQRVINEGLSVRATEELTTLMLKNSEAAGKTAPSSRRNTQHFDEYASSLTDLLDTQVKITLGAKKGRIAIEFASVDDLNRIMSVIAHENKS